MIPLESIVQSGITILSVFLTSKNDQIFTGTSITAQKRLKEKEEKIECEKALIY